MATKKQAPQQSQQIDVSGRIIMIPAEVYLAVNNYLATKPYAEVVQLLEGLKQAKLVEEEELTESPKKTPKKGPKKVESKD